MPTTTDQPSTEFDPTLPEGFYVRWPTAKGYLRFLEPEEAPEDVAEHVLIVAHAAAVTLRLPREVDVLLFEACAVDHPDAQGPSIFSEVYGFALQSRPFHIAVRADLSPEWAEKATAHEVRHLWQRVHGHHETHSLEDREKDAHRFDRAWMEARA